MRYGVAVLAVGLAQGVKLLLVGILTQDAPFLLGAIAVMVTAWQGGLGPGLLATALAAVFENYFFIKPFNNFGFESPGAIARFTLFILEGIGISTICAMLRAAQRRAEQSAQEARLLERRILEISDAEQRRIGHDLHDGLGQHLTGIALMTRQLEQRLSSDLSPHALRAAKISKLAESAVEWTSDLCRSLSPSALESRGLEEALRELAANVENIFSIECAFEDKGQTAFRDLPAAVHLYRIAQEAISNAVKHGQAKTIRVSLESSGNDMVMRIADDGSGMQLSERQHEGMGLRIMQYRAKMIGATIQVQQLNGKNGISRQGTVVTCRYPTKNSPFVRGS